MAIIKCKMCGGDLEVVAESRVAVCEYCGTQQTVPSADNEKKLTLFGRANRLRMACEFDKAAGVYESIVADFPEEAEAYWGLVLCKYGIEYVDDPATGKKIPTCHRSSFDSVMDDSNLEQALENADAIARRVYRDEAKAIEELRKGIIEVSGKEAPYDIFICYKETDDSGDRTIDSVIAQEVYDALTEKGYRVFFSRITLEDKLGQEYEPYIFAALHSAKIMLAFGTDYEYYNAVWVKNEWSRFLQLIAAGEKKTLIPCYKNIDAYDMPKEFARLQAQDMGKVGAMQDLLRGIEKILGSKEPKAAAGKDAAAAQGAQNNLTAPLIKRAFTLLSEGDWKTADACCERLLDFDSECAEAYLGKLMAELHIKQQRDLKDSAVAFDTKPNYIKAIQYAEAKGNGVLLAELKASAADFRKKREEEATIAREKAKAAKKIAIVVAPIICVVVAFLVVLSTIIIPNSRYNSAIRLAEDGQYEKSLAIFTKLGDYKDSTEKANSVYQRYSAELLKSAKAGDYVPFGAYEQDNNESNGKEAIEWLVLEVKDGKALVVSKYALDCKQYNSRKTATEWETCSLRYWLNNSFLSAAFSETEKAKIPTVAVTVDDGLQYTSAVRTTQDKIFLLSANEVNQYFKTNGARQCQPTAYAVDCGALVNNESDYCWWWLRTIGDDQYCAAYINTNGDVNVIGHSTISKDHGVRPVMWIDLNA